MSVNDAVHTAPAAAREAAADQMRGSITDAVNSAVPSATSSASTEMDKTALSGNLATAPQAESDTANTSPRTSKRCSGCNTVKSLINFFKDRKSADGLNSRCRSCKNTNNTTATRLATQATRLQARREAEAQGWQVHLRNGGKEHTFYRAHPSLAHVTDVQVTPRIIVSLDTEDWLRTRAFGYLMKTTRLCLKVNARSIGLSRFIMKCDALDGMVTHIDGNYLNNTKASLQLGVPTTGAAGVYHVESRRQWPCRIWIDNQWQTRTFPYESKDHPSYQQGRQQAILCRQENPELPGTLIG